MAERRFEIGLIRSKTKPRLPLPRRKPAASRRSCACSLHAFARLESQRESALEGCEERATLGSLGNRRINTDGVAFSLTGECRNPFGVVCLSSFSTHEPAPAGGPTSRRSNERFANSVLRTRRTSSLHERAHRSGGVALPRHRDHGCAAAQPHHERM